jgi:hypothetical protein
MTPFAAATLPADVVKSALVWRDMDQQQLDDAYDQEVYAPNREQIQQRTDA